MADDSTEVKVPFENCSSDTPASSTGYDFKVLSHDQQRKLNNLKIHTVRENYLYLKEHPEIPALVTILLKALFRSKPRNVRDFIAAYMRLPRLRGAVNALVEKQQQLNIEKSSVQSQTSSSEVGSSPLTLANIVFPSSLKVEDFEVEEIQEVGKEAAVAGEDIMIDILTLVDQKITQKEDYQMARNILDDIVTDLKPTIYPPCDPQSYRHSTSEKERQAKESIFVVEGIKDDLLALTEEMMTKVEDTQFIRDLLTSLIPTSECTQTTNEE